MLLPLVSFKYLIIRLLGSLLLFWLPGCSDRTADPAQRAAVTGQYFNLTGFIQEQMVLLNKEKPVAIKKVIEAGNRPETKNVTNLNWAQELAVFQELDLNKPAFRNAYTVARQQDPKTGGVTLTYRPKPDTDGNIQYLVIRTNASGHVQSIKGLQETNNLLLSTRRELQLNAQTKNGVTRLTSYRIQGLQKPIIFQALRYMIITELG